MESITLHSITVATDEAVRLWALSSTEYPKHHQPLITALVTNVIEVASTFALNARRAMELLPKEAKFLLNSPCWKWEPSTAEERINDLWDATNRIIHARRLLVGLESLPKHLSVITGESVFVPYIQAETDKKNLAFIDPFAMSHAYLYGALPQLQALAHAAGHRA